MADDQDSSPKQTRAAASEPHPKVMSGLLRNKAAARTMQILSWDSTNSRLVGSYTADSSDVDQGFRVKAIRVPAIPIKVGAQRRWRD